MPWYCETILGMIELHSVRSKYMCDIFSIETRHEKGEHDGASACVKQALHRYQMSHSAYQIKCSAEVVDWCTQNLGHQGHEQERSVPR